MSCNVHVVDEYKLSENEKPKSVATAHWALFPDLKIAIKDLFVLFIDNCLNSLTVK